MRRNLAGMQVAQGESRGRCSANETFDAETQPFEKPAKSAKAEPDIARWSRVVALEQGHLDKLTGLLKEGMREPVVSACLYKNWDEQIELIGPGIRLAKR
jgi:hypothetical protein